MILSLGLFIMEEIISRGYDEGIPFVRTFSVLWARSDYIVHRMREDEAYS